MKGFKDSALFGPKRLDCLAHISFLYLKIPQYGHHFQSDMVNIKYSLDNTVRLGENLKI